MTPPAAVGDVVDVDLERAATGGAVGRASGVVTFVRYGLPGERVRAVVTEVARTYQRADAREVVRASPDRVVAPCPYAAARECGGCDLQHATEEAQRAWKSAVASEHLRRIARVAREVPVRGLGPAEGSRVRLRCAVDDGRLGLFRARSQNVVVLERCWIADPRLGPAFSVRWPEAASVELRAIGEGDPFAVVRAEDGSVALRTVDGSAASEAHSTVTVHGHVFQVAPESFWQSHRLAPATLVAEVLRHVAASPDAPVVDLYGGVGLFGVSVARADPSRAVTIVEHSRAACDDARANARTLAGVEVVHAPVSAHTVREVVARGDLVVVDPPRTGMSSGALTTLADARPSRVVYVSCDAATLARDLARLVAAGYRLGGLEAFDLFPMTEHQELVAVLDDARP